MCGILGAVPAVEPERFRSVLGRLSHRGPDGEGVWQDREHAILGHRRLAILDVSESASQPMQYLGRYNIVFNGEIYNFLEIRRDLEGLGHQFKSSSDTEVLVAAFAQWGPHCLNRLNGMWAFAIWDSDERRLFLSRDRMGEKPLFYSHIGHYFTFASEQKALLPYLEHVRPSARFHEMSDSSYAYEATQDCLFENIRRFPAAHYGWLTDGRLETSRYWVPLHRSVDVPAKYPNQVDCLRELLLDACRIRMRADVPIGTGLSGGIDSSAVAACIAEIGRRGAERLPADWQNAFVAGFPGTVMDESAYAEHVAHHLGISVFKLDIQPDRYIDRIEDWAYLLEEVHEVNPLPHILLYRAMREQGVVVSLDGHGGDELFCGYESSILHALPDAAPNLPALRMVLDTYRNCHPRNKHFRGMSLPEILAYLARSRVRRMRDERHGTLVDFSGKRLGSLNSHLFELVFRTVLPTLLRNYDRYSMISGVEIRIPLLDHRIVDFAFAIPWQSKIRNGFTKAILRDAVTPWLPESIVTRKDKIGFAPPIRDWMRGPLREYLLDEIASHSFTTAELIKPRQLSATIRQLVFGSRPVRLYTAEQTWKQFGIYLWEKAFIQNSKRRFGWSLG
ncbi:asparagine synthase (glutamine-hydrolyzing) [Candidatus Methylomirabilis sp.]|uniref:asparagine synthase (glutamine-hydrolyzing) n=1 Tax=Candidatus Methylomirabilis sp. TaxID=2032687 RepID=UPI002A673A35|nr:asparagine synthase (glutamine-hydrolyzing) [Candidatus Methylomirabilis sp.]